MRASLFLLLFSVSSSFAASPLIIGGRGGTAVTDNAAGALGAVSSNVLGHSYSIGPTVGVRLPMGFSIEGDALYNRRTLGLGLGGSTNLSTHSDWWEFPVMAKFTAGHGVIAPVVGAGVSVQHIANFGSVPSYLFSGSTNANSVGFVASGGVAFRVGAVSVTPEIRYTRWNGGNFAQSLLNTLTGGRDQAQFLVGFTF
ncbi:MAG TPA: hypothetical protein VMZ52_08385 [Bryobacteraceae bacterium]|nr:hypothetical protein [Bryobacteraceae bacterium]